MLNLEDITALIPPAIIGAIIVFCIKFFGKVVSDQRPFADDRDWQRELDGISFFARNILSPIVGVFILQSKGYNPFLFNRYDLSLILLAIAVSVTQVFVIKRAHAFLKNIKLDEDKITAYLKKSFLMLVSLGILILLFYLFAKEMYFYFIAGSVYFVLHLISFAVYESLNTTNIVVSDIYFNDKTKMSKCRVMKINDDNVRVIKDDEIVILNKSMISKIETLLPSAQLNKQNGRRAKT